MTDLKELLGSRLRAFRAEVRADLEGLESRMRAEWKTELAGVEQRLETHIGQVGQRLESRMDQLEPRLLALEPRLLARVEQLIAKERGTQLRWTIGLWLSTMLAVLATRFV